MTSSLIWADVGHKRYNCKEMRSGKFAARQSSDEVEEWLIFGFGRFLDDVVAVACGR